MRPATFRGFLASATPTSPLLVTAPMVAHSELAFRLLTAKHGTNLCYTPMIHARHFVESSTFRKSNCDFTASLEGYSQSKCPVIAQICANDPKTAGLAARILSDAGVDGIDLNLGCPQYIAKKGDYGAYLLPQIHRVEEILTAIVGNSDTPVTAKVRIQDDMDTTVDICRRIEATGISLLTVHGRTVRENKQTVKEANWDAIKRVVESVQVPVVANGGVEYPSDVKRLLEYTGAAGVMSSESLLENPALFDSEDDWAMTPREVVERQVILAHEYLQLAGEHRPISFGGSGGDNSVKSHIFKILYRILDDEKFHHLRNRLGDTKFTRSIEDISKVVGEVEELIERYDDEALFGEAREVFDNRSWYRRHRKPPAVNELDERDERKAAIRDRMVKLKEQREQRVAAAG